MTFEKTRILIVDDMATMRKIIGKAVKGLGIADVTEAQDGEEAWMKIQGTSPPYTMILSDWNMPKCTGIELLRRVRENSKLKTLPFVLLTAEAEAHQVGEAVKLGATGYIVKPFTPEVLQQKLTAILSKLEKPATAAA